MMIIIIFFVQFFFRSFNEKVARHDVGDASNGLRPLHSRRPHRRDHDADAQREIREDAHLLETPAKAHCEQGELFCVKKMF